MDRAGSRVLLRRIFLVLGLSCGNSANANWPGRPWGLRHLADFNADAFW